MTFEELKEKAQQIVETLRKDYPDAELIEEDLTPGQPLPIAVTVDGAELVLNLDVL